MNKPYSIQIFMPDGNPDGLRTIEKSNWNGIGLSIPRPLIKEAKKSRNELEKAGVYILLGPSEDSGLPMIYIGEGDFIRDRLTQHASKKDFWTICIAFISKDSNLHKAHVQYLEARLIELAREAKRCRLDNNNNPLLPNLSEADSAEAEGFLSEMLLCLPILGINMFSIGNTPVNRSRTDFFIHAKGITAHGTEGSDGFVVFKDSQVCKTETNSLHSYLRALRADLINNTVLQSKGKYLIFTQDYTFSAPSTAAGVVLGRASNGRIEWVTKDGQTLKAIQEKREG